MEYDKVWDEEYIYNEIKAVTAEIGKVSSVKIGSSVEW